MKNKYVKLALPMVLAGVMLLGGCATAPSLSATGYSYQKQSEELLLFKSSNEELDFFLNDYFKRHSGYIDENGLDQKVNSVTAGVTSKQFFWQEWNSMGYYWFNSQDGFETDRIEGLRCMLSNIPVDDYGYVWQESDAVRPNNSTTISGEHRMGWPFPTSANVSGSSSWDFNGSATEKPWTSRISRDGNYEDNGNLKMEGGLLTADVEGVSSVEFSSPTTDFTKAYYSPLLEIDLRMYTADCDDIEDILVHYRSTKSGDWQSVSVKEKGFIDYEFTPSYEHLIFLPMYAEENWTSSMEEETYIRGLRVEIVAKEGKKIDGRFSLNYVRSTFDTRHTNNNSIFISSLRQDYDYTGDVEYLKEHITKARKAINFYMQMYDEARCLNDQSYLVGHDSNNTYEDLSDRVASTLANGYWDVSFMTKFDFHSNVYFYKALADLAYLEGVLEAKGIEVDKSLATVKTANRQYECGTADYGFTAATLQEVANDVLAALRAPINDSDKTGFWNASTGRFVAGYSDVEDKWYDYGYTVWNLEAIYYGVATDAQAKTIMEWIGGDRTVAADEYGSQGEDIYFFEFAPRTNTYSPEQQNDLSIFNASFTDPNCYYGETQVQNGGAIMYVSFFDLMARVETRGADDAFGRLTAIQEWYQDVYDYYVASNNYNVAPDRFYWDYYQNDAWENPKDTQYFLQNGIKGTNERGGKTAGVMGIDGEFLESFLVVSAIPYGFFGLEAKGGVLNIEPKLPEALTYWGMENLSYQNVKYDLTIFNNSVRIDAVRGNAAGLSVAVTLDAPQRGEKVYVNGRAVSDYAQANGKVTVNVPLAAVTVEVK